MLLPCQTDTAYLPAHLQAPLQERAAAALPDSRPLPLGRCEILDRFSELRSRLFGLESRLDSTYQRLASETTEESSREATFQHREHEPEALLEQYVLYDRHFKVLRAAELDAQGLAAQFSRTALGLLSDLPQAVLARDAFTALLAGVEGALGLLREDVREPRPAPVWAPPDDLAVVRFRWVTGHHLFGLWSHLGGDAFRQAGSLLEEPEACALEIERSRTFLAATSAAMEYATSFPGRFYREVLRPEMEASPMPGGFSGTQNSDYNHMKMQKGKLHAQLVLRYSRDPNRWPEPIRLAAERYRHTDLLDLEVHVRIAAGVVGQGQ